MPTRDRSLRPRHVIPTVDDNLARAPSNKRPARRVRHLRTRNLLPLAPRKRLHHFEERDPLRSKPRRERAEGLRRIRIHHARRVVRRIQSHRHAPRPPLTQQRLRRQLPEPHPVLQRPTELIRPQIRRGPQELVHEIAVRAVQLHTIEPSLARHPRGVRIVLDRAVHLRRFQRPRHRALHTHHPRIHIRLALLCPHRRRGNRRRAARLQRHMRDPPHVPQLRDDQPARVMHRVRHQPPPITLLTRVHPRRERVPLPLRADLRRLRNDEPGPRTLPVVLRVERPRHITRLAAARSRQRRHQHTIAKPQIAEGDRI